MNAASPSPAVSAVLENSLPLDDHDLLILRNVDQSLANAIEVKLWWKQKDASQSFAHQFNLIRSFNRPNRAVGFFDSAVVNGRQMELMGVVQEMFYDRADTGSAGILPAIRDELQEFITQYFMRISDFRSPEAAVEHAGENAGGNDFLSWCSRSTPNWQGFGYSQLYYKLKNSGKTGKFAEDMRYAIVDIRELGKTFEWIVMKVRIFDFNLTFRPFGPDFPAINIPLQEETYAILHEDFIVNLDRAGEKYFGEFGFGYGLLQIDDDRDSLLAYGPGKFHAGFQTIHFQMLPDGQSSVRLVFVVNRPDRLLNVPLNPARWGFGLADMMSLGTASRAFGPLRLVFENFTPTFGTFDPLLTFVELANVLTGGEAARQYCISKEQLEKEMLLQHFMQHYQMIIGSLLTWRQIPDWLDRANLPDWILRGTAP